MGPDVIGAHLPAQDFEYVVDFGAALKLWFLGQVVEPGAQRGVVPQRVGGGLQAAVAGAAAGHHVTPLLLGLGQVNQRQCQPQVFTADMRRAGTTADPVVQLVQLNVECRADGPGAHGVFERRGLQAAPRIKGITHAGHCSSSAMRANMRRNRSMRFTRVGQAVSLRRERKPTALWKFVTR